MQAQKILTLAGNIVISVGFLDILEIMRFGKIWMN